MNSTHLTNIVDHLCPHLVPNFTLATIPSSTSFTLSRPLAAGFLGEIDHPLTSHFCCQPFSFFMLGDIVLLYFSHSCLCACDLITFSGIF